ncbi:MAG: DUF5663 domain-containing protein [Patescibacteria group bacterium]
MNNKELHNILIKELGIQNLPEEAQNEIVSKLGEIILKSITVTIFEQLPPEGRAEFESITQSGDNDLIQEFLGRTIPDLPDLMEAEVKKVLLAFKTAEMKRVNG